MTEHILHPPTTKRPPSPWAIALSILLNLLFAALLLWVSYVWKKEAERFAAQQQQVQVELVPAPQPQPQAQPQPPPPQQQQQQQQEKKEQEKKEQEKPPEEKKEKPPEKQPEKPPEKQPEHLARPQAPQLQQAQIRDKSSTTRHDEHNGSNGQNVAIAMGPGPMLSIRNKEDDGTRGPEGSKGPVGEELSQNEQDFVLSQILPYWKVDTHRPEGRGMVLEAIIEINPDGTLQAPLGANDPWRPDLIIGGYADLTRLGYTYRREALEGFLLALRLSQPIKVPPGGKWPKWMKLRFAFDDL